MFVSGSMAVQRIFESFLEGRDGAYGILQCLLRLCLIYAVLEGLGVERLRVAFCSWFLGWGFVTGFGFLRLGIFSCFGGFRVIRFGVPGLERRRVIAAAAASRLVCFRVFQVPEIHLTPRALDVCVHAWR